MSRVTLSRLKLTLTSLLLAVALVVSMGAASGGTVPAVPAQNTDDIAPEETALAVMPNVTPFAGLVAASPTKPWVTEVRIPVIIENGTAESFPADLSALGGLGFSIRDSSGTQHPLDGARPQRGVSPSHSLRDLDPDMAARWTLGFQVPTANASGLVLELHHGPDLVETWPVDELSDRANGALASNPTGTSLTMGDDITWEPGLTATPLEIGSLVCGDPAIETVTHIVAVTFEVTNTGSVELRWPGYIHRDGASVAQWADGTSADMSVETYVGDEETLPRISTFAVRIPPMTTATRALVFAAPRDGRFSDITAVPTGIMLRSPAARVWLDLTGVDPTMDLSPAFCDLGFFGGPLPFGFSPGPKFEIGGESVPPDNASLDAAARMAITEALAGAALYYDSHGESFAAVSGEDLVAEAPRLTFVGEDVAADATGGTGVVFFDTRADDDQYIYVATRSASGRWFCAGVIPHRTAMAADSTDLNEIKNICFPETTVDEG